MPSPIDLSNLYLRRAAVSRSISAENPEGTPGGGAHATAETTLNPPSARHARELGPGWKMSPCRPLPARSTVTLMDHEGPGVIRHIWITLDPAFYRNVVLRMYWEHAEHPSIECPIGDFFCCSWNDRQKILAQPVNVNPRGGMNLYFPMPFRERVRITVENQATEDLPHFFYTINFTLEPVSEDALYFHAHWRRENPLPLREDYVMLDGVRGQGQYVGAFMAWQQNGTGWWGEGEIKMYLDADDAYPTICGTGTEDYFGGAWCFGENYSAPYLGYQLVSGEESHPGARMTMYRFHVLDPVFFRQSLRVTMQALGWQSESRYLPLQDDIASVVYWYQTLPHMPFPPLPDRDARTII
jgi:hypothetical protein